MKTKDGVKDETDKKLRQGVQGTGGEAGKSKGIADNMRAELCVQTVENAYNGYPNMRGAVLHSDRGSQYTSEKYRSAITNLGIIQSMNSVGGRV